MAQEKRGLVYRATKITVLGLFWLCTAVNFAAVACQQLMIRGWITADTAEYVVVGTLVAPVVVIAAVKVMIRLPRWMRIIVRILVVLAILLWLVSFVLPDMSIAGLLLTFENVRGMSKEELFWWAHYPPSDSLFIAFQLSLMGLAGCAVIFLAIFLLVTLLDLISWAARKVA